MGGDDSKENLVKLTIREHLLAHLLLAKTMISPLMICAYHFMKRNNYSWTEEMSTSIGSLISEAKRDLDNSAAVHKGWKTWKEEAGDHSSRFLKAWETRREKGSDRATDFSPEAVLKRSMAAKESNRKKLANPDFDGSTPVLKGWETRRKRESDLDPEELSKKKRETVEKCNETKRKNGTFKRSKESIEKQKRTIALKKSNKEDDIV
jgi:allantoicase